MQNYEKNLNSQNCFFWATQWAVVPKRCGMGFATKKFVYMDKKQ